MSRADSSYTELRDLVHQVFVEMGGVGNQEQVTAHLRLTLPAHLTDYLVSRGLAQAISRYWRERDESGLPRAPEVDEHGTHMDRELMDPGEYRYTIGRYMERAAQNRQKAFALAVECRDRHGVWIDPAGEVAAS